MDFCEYTVSSVASRYHVTTQTVLTWIRTGKLKATEHYGCRPKWLISEEQIAEFELNYARRDGIKPKVVKSTFQMTDNGEVFKISVSESETEEDIRLIKGIKRLNEVFECYPYLKEMILELADRL